MDEEQVSETKCPASKGLPRTVPRCAPNSLSGGSQGDVSVASTVTHLLMLLTLKTKELFYQQKQSFSGMAENCNLGHEGYSYP